MKCSVFIATSLDGFIAREDGAIDWLPAIESEPDGGDYGWSAFIGDIDFIIMGRNTFELLSTFSEWPYGDLKIIVLSTTLTELSGPWVDRAELMNATPANLIANMEARGAKHLYIDGGKTIQNFLSEGLINELTITRIPVLIGTGIPLFAALENDVKLELIRSQSFSNGIVQSVYSVKENS